MMIEHFRVDGQNHDLNSEIINPIIFCTSDKNLSEFLIMNFVDVN